MKLFKQIKNHMTALTMTISRYPVSTAYLIAIVIVRVLATEGIYDNNELYNQIFTALLLGFFISICIRASLETFLLHRFSKQMVLYSLNILLTIIYYFYLRFESNLDGVGWLRTAILCFGLFIAFLWIPSKPKETVDFQKTFMSGFKAYFITLLFSGVLFLGITLVIAAIDNLLFSVNSNTYAHFATFVFLFFSPVFYLSLIPNFTTASKERIEKATQTTAFLETLLSYVVIPLSAIFTLILILYILLNIRGDFWQENLLEPMLVSYSIVIISVLLLSIHFNNAFATWFIRIFPKLLIPLVLLQIIASIMKIESQGITHGRYFVILYGLFALATGIIFSFFSKKHLGIIAILFIASTLISTIPPVDAFTISKNRQIALLEETLTQNDMLVNGQIISNATISDESKTKISELTSYLHRMNYLQAINWLPEDFNYYQDFESVFGFSEYQYYPENPRNEGSYYSSNRDMEQALNIEGYTYLLNLSVAYRSDSPDPLVSQTFTANGSSYQVTWEANDQLGRFTLIDGDKTPLITLNTQTYEDASYESENTQAKIKVIPNYVNLYFEDEQMTSFNSDIIILVQLK